MGKKITMKQFGIDYRTINTATLQTHNDCGSLPIAALFSILMMIVPQPYLAQTKDDCGRLPATNLPSRLIMIVEAF
jgi:hypothetical protein